MSRNIDLDILKALKEKGDYISGEELADKFKITRQALWKHINRLIEKGYNISAVPHLGYRFISAPDRLYPEEILVGLKTKFIGQNIYYYQSVDSTQDIAWQLGSENVGEGTIVVSETQNKGRGRFLRKWVSSPGGIYFSLILRPKHFSIAEFPKITLLVSLACVQGIKESVGVECQVKWPNDIFLGDKKLGGILSEVNAEQDNIHFVVLGVGINVNNQRLPPVGTSLFLKERKYFPRVDILRKILERIEVLYREIHISGAEKILREWENLCFLWGRRIRVNNFGNYEDGEAIGIDEYGRLLLRKDSGVIKIISCGDVHISAF